MTEDEFDLFYMAACPRLVGQLYAMTGDYAEAQDVVQEAFARAWERRSSVLNGDRDPEAWIRTVAHRLAMSHWRRSRRWWELVRGQSAPRQAPEPSPDHVALVAALRRLPEVQRTAIVLHHLCDLSVEQIAAETGAAVGTVKARLSRGRTALAAHLVSEETHSPEEACV
ncbi:SigE family RNA polymerase sigma factor [Streptomyces alanosinicus]|uniref:RNA polymerase sigma factor n=1 Tax=Streptomyces alanosinicus TaxID=68171 RepID=A0A918YIU7_9ACTN|nr:SigE family RNA polymerase sigma factor [Streptomyces alanosinicus]GHE05614.1 RNA polymerase sigma24 factor [Streptomyces alanosinicus]